MFFSCAKQEKNQKKFANLQFDRLCGFDFTAHASNPIVSQSG